MVEIGVRLVKAFWKWVGRCAIRYGKGLKSMVSFPKASELWLKSMFVWSKQLGTGQDRCVLRVWQEVETNGAPKASVLWEGNMTDAEGG